MMESLHRVCVMQDTLPEVPELYSDVFVAGDEYEERAFAQLFVRTRSRRARTLDEADYVIFTGGPDVNPSLYGHNRNAKTRIDNPRDSRDMKIFQECLDKGIPMIGICRGAQFLHVMHGGTLYQDVDNHNSPHMMYDCVNKTTITKISSVHHQMIKPPLNNPDFHVIGYIANRSNRREEGPGVVSTGFNRDIEAFEYLSTATFGVQGHPEYAGFPEYSAWFLNMVQHVLLHNPNVGYADTKVLRLKPEFLAAQKALRAAKKKGSN